MTASTPDTRPLRIAVIAGDGIGREVMPEGLRVLEAAARRFGLPLAFTHFDWAHCDYYRQHGHYPSAVTGGGTYAVNTEATFTAQLASFTSAAGVVSTTKDATYKYGPYLKKSTLPAEPINNIATVEIVTTGTLGMTASGSTGGWKFDNKTGQLIANITAYQTR